MFFFISIYIHLILSFTDFFHTAIYIDWSRKELQNALCMHNMWGQHVCVCMCLRVDVHKPTGIHLAAVWE